MLPVAGRMLLVTCLILLSNLQGSICLNGRPVDKEMMLRISGFVPQQDLADPVLTVREHLWFMANLMMDRRVSRMQRLRCINSLILELGLTRSAHTRLGALSGGERKRLTLAVQMLTDPPILFCDEVTTGLDSYTAGTVVGVLRQLATTRGKAVLCSIHQPASGVFEQFDTVTLLLPGGSLAYHGDVISAKSHFESLGIVCPPAYNPAEFIVNQLNRESQSDHDAICEKFALSLARAELDKELEVERESSTNLELMYGIEEKFIKFYSIQRPSQSTQLIWLVWRSTLGIFRNSQRLGLKFVMYILTGLLVSSPFADIKVDQEGIQNLQGFNYAVITETIFTQAYSVMHTFPAEIPILLREISNGVYQPGPYYFSKMVILIPRVMLETLVFCMVVFYVAGVNSETTHFGLFYLPVAASAIASTAYGCCLSAMFESVSTASLLSVPIDFISYTFCGIFLQLNSVPLYLHWVKYVSRFYYGLEAISILQWRGIDNIPCSDNPMIPCISTGEGVLHKYGYQESNLRLDFTGLLVTFCALHLLGYLALRHRSRSQSVY